MKADQKTARVLGALFVFVMVTWFIGLVLIDPLLNAPDYLLNVYENETRVMIGALFELIEVVGVVGIIIVMYPLLRRYDERFAVGYAGLRILECTMLIVAALGALFLITLSQDYVAAGAADASYYQTLGTLTKAVRGEWSTLILAIFYSTSALIFFYFFYQSQLIPRFISVVGLIGAALVAAGTVLAFFGINVRMFFGLPMGLIEIFLGLWLIVKGFNTPAVEPAPAKIAVNQS